MRPSHLSIASPSRSRANIPQLVVVKIPREMRREKLAKEIQTLQLICDLAPTPDISRQFPHVLVFDPVIPKEGSRWLSMCAIHGFSLDQLLATVQKSEFFSLRGEEKTVPRVLVLHIAKN
jgi:hypothetical protein